MSQSKPPSSSVNPKEINQFNRLADEWWNPRGSMAPLHRMNPTRLHYIKDTLLKNFKTIKGLKILDIGCGGGLVSEPLARLGAHVTGIDGAGELIKIAKLHASTSKVNITYRHTLTAELMKEHQQFDVVLALEVLEHVPDQGEFVHHVSQLAKPGGMVIFSTLNRSAASFAFGVVAAEYVLRWLPTGTHHWSKFMKPSELYALCQASGLKPQQTMGLTYKPVSGDFVLNEQNLQVNYFLTAKKPL
jgi:2-polyprenyl-6-hydroxyphenyl methylase / 3-demethylubiquinone-9 3-methyltransferase